MKRVISFIFITVLLFASVSVAAFAEEKVEQTTNIPRDPGWCGEDITWSFDKESGILTFSGNGAMDDFPEGTPWAEYKEDILAVQLWGNIDYIGAYAFEDCDAIEAVYFGTALRELGKRAFYSCDGLTRLELPATFRCFGEESLRNCTFLKEIHCLGPMPSFRLNCLWDTWARIYYPTNNPWPLEHIQQLEGAFQGRIEFLAEDGFDPYEPPAPTEETTEPTEETTQPTEETTEPTTEPAAEPDTEPTTQPATEPSTEPAAQPPTEDMTEAPTEPPTEDTTEPEEQGKSGSWIGLALIGMALSGFLLGGLIFGRRKPPKKGKGRYSR